MPVSNKPKERVETMKKFYTVEELALELSVCRETIRRRIRGGIILSLPVGRYHRIPVEEVKKFCAACSDE
jgi:excisionase family DNA binding protein